MSDPVSDNVAGAWGGTPEIVFIQGKPRSVCSPSHTEGKDSLNISWLYRKFEPYPFALCGYLMHFKFGCVLDLYPLDVSSTQQWMWEQKKSSKTQRSVFRKAWESLCKISRCPRSNTTNVMGRIVAPPLPFHLLLRVFVELLGSCDLLISASRAARTTGHHPLPGSVFFWKANFSSNFPLL